MDDKSKLPSWVKDRKKFLIIIIVIICLIGSAINTAVIGFVSGLANSAKLVAALGSMTEFSDVFDMLGSSKMLNGTYQNNYVDESMEFGKDGSLVYSYAGNVVFGEYEIEDNTLIIELDGYEYYFDILTNDGKVLDLTYGAYEYNYTKL